jgi:N-acetylglucosaminyldiphosphoundecaprenol N-acetyl-beta-D-mannosaminyltransferase
MRKRLKVLERNIRSDNCRSQSGYWDDDAKIVEEINDSGAKLLIVALGSPKQEYRIRDNIQELRTVRVAGRRRGVARLHCG